MSTQKIEDVNYLIDNLFDNNKCKCGVNITQSLHPCPFAIEIYDNYDECDCCDDCAYNCAIDV